MTEGLMMKIGLRQMIIALETAVDLVGVNDTNHGKRVGYIASQLAHFLKMEGDKAQFAFDLGLLHDCGVSTEQMHSNLVAHFDWGGANLHCEIGYRLLKHFEPLSRFAAPILYHHTPWEQLKDLDIDPVDKQMANLIFLADRIDALAAPHYDNDILLARDDILKTINSHSGSYFEPGLVAAFVEMEKTESFWLALEPRHVTRFTWDMGNIQSQVFLSIKQLKQLSLIMAYIVDQKSPFTAQHSTRVGVLVQYLGSLLGLSESQCEKIEISGFLHDIGKLRTPDNILEKPGALDKMERAIMNQHSYETFEILRHIDGLEDIARWAAYHHEEIEGTGYPFHPAARELEPEARIIAVADIFQALVQDRPYRKGLNLTEVISILDDCVKNGKLDEQIVALAKQQGEKCYQLARGEGEENRESEQPLFSLQSKAA